MAVSTSGPTHHRRRTQEQLLLEYMQRLESRRVGRKAVRINISELMPANKRDHHVRAAVNSFEGLVSDLQGQLFTLNNQDLFFVYKSDAHHRVEDVGQKIKFLFGDDPLFDEKDDSELKFIKWFDVEHDYDEVLGQIQDMAPDKPGSEKTQTRSNVRAQLKAKQDHGSPLTPDILGRTVKALKRTDLSNLVRRQFICGVSKKLIPEQIFSEIYISINDLRQTMLPDINLTSNRWLFQHLTESLDRRILSMLAKSDQFSFSGDISFNVNVSTILSPEFMQFDENISAARRGSMVLEVQPLDIFSDLDAFLFAREFVREKGYRLCLDGLTHQTMRMFDRARVGADYMKVHWNSELMDGGEETIDRLKGLIDDAGKETVIMTRCDNREAVDFGRSVGIGMFQGHFIEHLIAEDDRRRQLLKLKHNIERN
ncbi:MAG: EAL domain-containing protein [Rhodospirillaceae bacterium]|nr:EAL domain-containing protein [Rhodospirillaceae bacterium]